MLKLYAIAGTCSLAPHILLHELGEDFELILLDRSRGEQNSQGYLAINPRGKVPALQVDGAVITENVAIQLFLSERVPTAALAPADALLRAQWMSLITWVSNWLHPSYRQFRRPEYFAADASAHAAIQAKGKDAFLTGLAEVNQLLRGRKWLFGEQYSTADAYIHVFHYWARASQFEISGLSELQRHGEQMMLRPATQTAFEREGLPLNVGG